MILRLNPPTCRPFFGKPPNDPQPRAPGFVFSQSRASRDCAARNPSPPPGFVFSQPRARRPSPQDGATPLVRPASASHPRPPPWPWAPSSPGANLPPPPVGPPPAYEGSSARGPPPPGEGAGAPSRDLPPPCVLRLVVSPFQYESADLQFCLLKFL